MTAVLMSAWRISVDAGVDVDPHPALAAVVALGLRAGELWHAGSNYSSRCAAEAPLRRQPRLPRRRRRLPPRRARTWRNSKASLEALAKVKPAEDGVAALKTATKTPRATWSPPRPRRRRCSNPKLSR